MAKNVGMEFAVTREALAEALEFVKAGAERGKTTIPVLANVLLEADEAGVLRLTATDLELSVRCQCAATVMRPGSVTVPAKRLHDYVKQLPKADILVRVTDEHWVSLVCGRARAKFAGLAPDSFPAVPVMPEPVATLPAVMFGLMVARTVFAISMEESRFTLNGALLVRGDDGLLLVATDGHRLAYTRVKEEGMGGEPLKVLVPKKAMSEILSLAADAGEHAEIALGIDENHLFFQMGDRVLTTRKLSGNFPDFQRVLPSGVGVMVADVLRADLKAALDRVGQFADEVSHAVRILFTSGVLRVFSSSVESGESEEMVPCEYGGPDVEIGFNAKYLGDFLRTVSAEHVLFRVSDAKAAGELRPAGDESYRYVVMPMRV